MDVAGLIEGSGYLAVAAGTFLEGEATLIAAGFAAYRGYLSLSAVVAVAALASFLGDQLYFQLGRRYGPSLLARFPAVQAKAVRVQDMLHRHHLPLILSIRFLYGLRSAGLIAIGMSRVSALRFSALSFVSAVVWAVVVGSAGYLFGRTIERLMTDMRDYEAWIMVGILLSASVCFLRARRRSRAIEKQER
jgi:membrane protein DedA with SNARE-associated domain